MPLTYTKIHELSHEHSDKILAVAISPKGAFTATAGLDGSVRIWATGTGRLVYSIQSDEAVHCICWLPGREDQLLCGLKDGSVTYINMTNKILSLAGFHAHAHPVEHIAVLDDRIATGGYGEVSVWKSGTVARGLKNGPGLDVQRLAEDWIKAASIAEPQVDGRSSDDEVLVTSLHWTSMATHAVVLLITYMRHGIYIVDGSSYSAIRVVRLPGLIGSASLSHDGTLLAVSNVDRGFDIYEAPFQTASISFNHDEPIGNTPLPVLLIHEDSAMVGASICGNVRIWEVRSGRMLDVNLLLKVTDRVLCIAANYDSASDVFLLAMGITSQADGDRIIIWKGTELDSVGATRTRGIEQDNTIQATQSTSAGMMQLVTAVLCITVLLLAYLLGVDIIQRNGQL